MPHRGTHVCHHSSEAYAACQNASLTRVPPDAATRLPSFSANAYPRCIRTKDATLARKPTIAIVNNETSIVRSLGILLEREQFCVRSYSNTHDALELIDCPADLALLDKTNPPLGGMELYRRLRARHAMPVIFLSAWADEIEEQLRGTGQEANAYIQLPFSQRHVIDVIKAALDDVSAPSL